MDACYVVTEPLGVHSDIKMSPVELVETSPPARLFASAHMGSNSNLFGVRTPHTSTCTYGTPPSGRACPNSLTQLHTASYSFTQLHTASHSFAQLHTASYGPTRLHTASHGFTRLHTRLHTASHGFTRLHTASYSLQVAYIMRLQPLCAPLCDFTTIWWSTQDMHSDCQLVHSFVSKKNSAVNECLALFLCVESADGSTKVMARTAESPRPNPREMARKFLPETEKRGYSAEHKSACVEREKRGSPDVGDQWQCRGALRGRTSSPRIYL